MPGQYQKIMQTLETRIASGTISGRLPSIAAMEQEFHVSHATVKKVIDQLKLLGVVYGKQGKGVFVSDKRNGAKGVIAIFLPLAMYGTPFYMRLLSALQPRLQQQGYEVFSRSTLADMIASNADWAVIFGDSRDPDTVADLTLRFGQRVININNHLWDKLFAINNDNFQIGYQAIEYLYAHGHRKIGVLSRELECNGLFTRRMDGARDFAAHHPDVELFNESISGDEHFQSTEYLATTAAVKLLDKAPEITAVFAFTDVLAIGVLSEIQRCKLRIPEDISLISIDNRSFAGLCNPPLTTFEEDAEAMAETVADKIMENFETGLPSGQSIRIAAKLMERSSVRTIENKRKTNR